MSVLAHVVLKGSLPGEPAATQALAHILNAPPDIARAFLGTLRQADIEFEPGHVQAELGHEDSRPDLTIHDDQGRVRGSPLLTPAGALCTAAAPVIASPARTLPIPPEGRHAVLLLRADKTMTGMAGRATPRCAIRASAGDQAARRSTVI